MPILVRRRQDLATVKVINDKATHNDYCAVHRYIKRILTKPLFCSKCNKNPATELANKYHTYNIEILSDWWYLCKSCHERWDYSNGLRKNNSNNRKRTAKGTFCK